MKSKNVRKRVNKGVRGCLRIAKLEKARKEGKKQVLTHSFASFTIRFLFPPHKSEQF